jgi:hypothetical protein
MAFVDLSRSEEVKVEVYCAALLLLLTFAFSPPFWIAAVLAVLLSAVVAHLIVILSSAIEVTRAVTGLMAAGVVTTLLLLTWLHTRPPAGASSGQVVVSGSAKATGSVQAVVNSSRRDPTDPALALDTARLVERLREFQRKLDRWNLSAATELKLEELYGEAGEHARRAHVEHAKQLSGAVAKLEQEFNNELKPQIVVVHKRLMDRVPPESRTPKSTVDWVVQYGFTTYPNAIRYVADELQDLANKLSTN